MTTFTIPTRATIAAAGPDRSPWALPVLLSGTVMIVLDFFVVNVALPSIRTRLHAGPAAIDRWSGYRYYRADQVSTAQVIRRFRDLGMPVDQVKAVLEAPDPTRRNEVIMAHLDRMQEQLAQTQSTVESLRQLLDPDPTPLPVQYRTVADIPALAIAETVAAEDGVGWWMDAFDELYRAVRAAGGEPAGPGGALLPGGFYDLAK